MRRFALLLSLFIAAPAVAAGEKIVDNSLLIEEAYNQLAGEVQHVNLIDIESGGGWAYSFTQEWPFLSEKHQISYSLPLVHPEHGDTDLGDVGLHYRYQLFGGASEKVWVAPRATVLLPTGDSDDGTGNGAMGYQVGVPVSVEIHGALTVHLNSGMTYIPSAEAANGAEHDTLGFNAGAGAVYYITPGFNALLEVVGTRGGVVTASGGTSNVSTFFVNPGLRFGTEFSSGLRCVPAISYYHGVGGSHGDNGVLGYVSFEYAFR